MKVIYGSVLLALLNLPLLYFSFGMANLARSKRNIDTNIHNRLLPDKLNSSFIKDVMRRAKAAEMRNYMNESVNPCDDFYEFACGQWSRINPADSLERITTGLFEIMGKAMERKISKILRRKGHFDGETDTDKKTKAFYESCLKFKKLSSGEYRDKLFDIIAEFGEMPALCKQNKQPWNEQQFDWLQTVGEIAFAYNKEILLSMEVMPDFQNNSVNCLYIGQAAFPLESRSMYMDNETAKYRRSYKVKVAKDLMDYLGIDEELALQTAVDIVNFETSLAAGMLDDKLAVGLADISIKTTVLELQTKYAIDFTRLVNITMGEMVHGSVYELVEGYTTNLFDVLRKTPKSIVANYIFYSLLEDFIVKMESSVPKQEISCIKACKKYFAKNLDNMVYRESKTQNAENDVQLIWSELKKRFEQQLNSAEFYWMEQGTRQHALRKLNAMKMEINSYANNTFSEEFADLEISNDDYIENIKNLLRLESVQSVEELHKPPTSIEAGELLSYTPANIIIENKIRVPVALLQPYYLWSSNYPNALKFSTLGSLLGHELIHGFDDMGRRYDKDGNSRNWWDTASTNAFNAYTKCFMEQYSKYKYDGKYLPKSPAQSENIADNGGLRLAYAAYSKWLEETTNQQEHLDTETLPSMNYNNIQLFFISYAQVWCNAVHPSLRGLQTSTDEHVPGKFRVIGPLSNFDAFGKAFNCAKGSKMNPIEKCSIY